MRSPSGWDAVILTGGGAQRLDGVAKHRIRFGGRTMLERVVGAVGGADRVIVVGPPDDTVGVDLLVREEPAGAGPVAALAAGLAVVRSDRVIVLAGDLPFLSATAVAELLAAITGEGVEGAPDAGSIVNSQAGGVAIAVDDNGRDQYLLAAWTTSALWAVLTAVGPPAGLALRAVYSHVEPRRIRPTGDPPPWFDCDTPLDLARAQHWAARGA